ncbi:MAG: hypothetical protein GY861_16825 [bacterium]|nr:hypothetical protein [bacterium]
MARKKKTLKESVFGTSDFSIKAATTGTIDVGGVSGSSQVGFTTDYPGSAELTITEVSATVTNISAVDVTVDSGNTIAIVWTDPGTLLAGTSGIDFTVTNVVAGNVVAGSIGTAKAQITLNDGLSASTVLTSSEFTLSAIGDGRMSPYAPKSLAWRSRMIDEGII